MSSDGRGGEFWYGRARARSGGQEQGDAGRGSQRGAGDEGKKQQGAGDEGRKKQPGAGGQGPGGGTALRAGHPLGKPASPRRAGRDGRGGAGSPDRWHV